MGAHGGYVTLILTPSSWRYWRAERITQHFRGTKEPCGPFSLRPLPWPAPLLHPTKAEPVEPTWQALFTALGSTQKRFDRLHVWQQQVPPDSPDPDVDYEVIRLIYGQHAQQQDLIRRFADSQCLSDAEWALVLERWTAIRQWQRQYVLTHCDSIPDRLERQRWLSRLLVAQPRILLRIDYARTCRTIVWSIGDRATRAIGNGVRQTPPSGAVVAQPTFAAIDQPLPLRS